MTNFRLPNTANIFLRGLAAKDIELLMSTMHGDAVLREGSRDHRGVEIKNWTSAYLAEHPFGGRVVDRRWDERTLVLTLLVGEVRPTKGRALFHWRLRIEGDHISEITVERAKMPDVTPVVSRFINGVNNGNLGEILESFSDDALVNDELVDYAGAEAIKGWVERDVVGKSLALFVVQHQKNQAREIVTCHATGDFDGLGLPEPLILSLYCSLQGDEIGQLIILQKPDGAIGHG